MPNTIGACKNCRFFKKVPEEEQRQRGLKGNDYGKEGYIYWGLCRRYPPSDGNQMGIGVSIDHWCGEYREGEQHD